MPSKALPRTTWTSLLGGPNKAGEPDTAVQDGDALFFWLASPNVFSGSTETVSCTTIHFIGSADHM